MKYIVLAVAIISASPTLAFENKGLKLDAGFGQSSFNNWQSGGSNSTAYNLKLRGEADSVFENAQLKQNFKLAYGRVKQSGEDIKTEDELLYKQTWTFLNTARWKPYLGLDLLTQIAEGFTTSDTDPSSYAFDPLFLTESLGAFRNINSTLSAQIGLAAKQTIVNKATIVDNISEVGGEARLIYKDTWAEEFDVQSDVKLFYSSSDLEDLDIHFNFLISTKITKHINWMYEFNIIYDTDISEASQTRQNNRLGLSIDLI